MPDEPFQPPALPLPFAYTPPDSPHAPVLLAQGAEGLLYKSHFLTPDTPAALKIRPSKHYRHAILDRRLTKQRILQEARCLLKLTREGVPVPAVLAADWEGSADEKEGRNGGAWLLMEWIDGIVVRKVVDQWEKWVKGTENKQAEGWRDEIKQAEEDMCAFLRRIGQVVGSLHKAGVIHGDLTTSNLMLRERKPSATAHGTEINAPTPNGLLFDGEIVLIDFGLAGQSVQDEDRAVDLYVLERAFGSSHPRTENFFEEVLKGYGESYKGAQTVLRRLQDVRMRGRKRSMIG
ncbi:hypothetical protein VTO42DRAFT_7182 [Malbranchea cinnamomea]